MYVNRCMAHCRLKQGSKQGDEAENVCAHVEKWEGKQ